MESTVSLLHTEAFGPTGPPTTTYATFSWNFGDGTPEVKGFAPGAPICEAPWLSPCAASAFHSYQYGGKYNVTLTVTDIAGNTTSVTHEVTVNGPAAPTPPAPPSPPAGGSSGGSAGTAAAALRLGRFVRRCPGSRRDGQTAPPRPRRERGRRLPLASLRAEEGPRDRLLSVNEQVAGQFQVLLASSIAKRIGLHGAPATDMPPGSVRRS